MLTMKEILVSVGTCVLVMVRILVQCQDLLPTCSNIAKQPMSDISAMYECKPLYDPENGMVRCTGYIEVVMRIDRELTFRVLEEFPHDVNKSNGISRCVGIVNISATDTSMEYPSWDVLMTYRADFNSSMAVGTIHADVRTWESGGYCNISILNSILNLKLFRNSSMPWRNIFWDSFWSPLYGVNLKWIQGLSAVSGLESISLRHLQTLQNTSIQALNMSGMVEDDQEVYLKDMPFLRKIVLDADNISSFHQDNFIGTPEVEEFIIRGTYVDAVPESLIRLSNLRILEISYTYHNELFNISTEVLSSLIKLESLKISRVRLGSVSGKLPLLPKLKSLTLSECQIPLIEEDDMKNFPLLQELDLSVNSLTVLGQSTFMKNQYLHFVDLSQNKLTNWPLLYGCSIMILNLSTNSISYLKNMGKLGTTVEHLNLSRNKIIDWNDEGIFRDISSAYLPRNFNTPNSYQQTMNYINARQSHHGTENVLVNASDNETKLEIVPEQNGNEKKSTNQNLLLSQLVLRNIHLQVQAHIGKAIYYNKTKLNGLWVNNIDLSHNTIAGLSKVMIRSLNGLHHLDLGGNHFDCIDCRMIPFQKWLNTTLTVVTNIGTHNPLLCSSPENIKGIPVVQVQFDEEPCLDKRTSWWAIIGIPAGAAILIVSSALGVVYSFRSQITYILHLYKIRSRAKKFTGTAYDKYAFDAFVCYSGADGRWRWRTTKCFMKMNIFLS